MFKQVFHKTPYQYLNEIRIEKSLELLAKKISVKEVSRKLGFTDSSSFSRLFFNQVGVYPTQI
ncbi:MAG: helix-turn-helix domain-containing protein [Flammeovirgaceae bacterium]|nr:helix-turn-helix domain-containing protein [Flammeovirgaceae bacterium]